MMEITGALFRFAAREETYEFNGEERSHTLIDVFVEDDGDYQKEMTFDALWLPDLLNMTNATMAVLETLKPTQPP